MPIFFSTVFILDGIVPVEETESKICTLNTDFGASVAQ